MVSDRIRKVLDHKSTQHQADLLMLGKIAEKAPISPNCMVLSPTPQIKGIQTLLFNPLTEREDFIFYTDRLSTLLIEHAVSLQPFASCQVVTPVGVEYMGRAPTSSVSAVILLRGGTILEPALHRIVPDVRTGRILIQSSFRTGEPELHYLKLPEAIANDGLVLLLDAQMSSGGSALMAVRILVDHGVQESRIVFVTMHAGRRGMARLLSVFADVRVVIAGWGEDGEERWVEKKYLGC